MKPGLWHFASGILKTQPTQRKGNKEVLHRLGAELMKIKIESLNIVQKKQNWLNNFVSTHQ